MAETTEVVGTADWLYLVDLINAARIAASQIALPQTTAYTINYRAKEGNIGAIEFTVDPPSNVVSKRLLAEEFFDEAYDNQSSLRNWYIKGDGLSLIVTLQS